MLYLSSKIKYLSNEEHQTVKIILMFVVRYLFHHYFRSINNYVLMINLNNTFVYKNDR